MCWLALLPDIHLVCVSCDGNRSPDWSKPNQHWGCAQIWDLHTHTHTHTQKHTLYTVCLCSRPLYHFQLWPPERTGGPERLWWICQTQRVWVCVCVCVWVCSTHLYAYLTMLHPVAELCYLFSLVYFTALCKPSPQLPCILVQRRCLLRK